MECSLVINSNALGRGNSLAANEWFKDSNKSDTFQRHLQTLTSITQTLRYFHIYFLNRFPFLLFLVFTHTKLCVLLFLLLFFNIKVKTSFSCANVNGCLFINPEEIVEKKQPCGLEDSMYRKYCQNPSSGWWYRASELRRPLTE